MSDDPLVECEWCGKQFELSANNIHEHAFPVGKSSKDWFCSVNCAKQLLQDKVNHHTELMEFYSDILGKIARKQIEESEAKDTEGQERRRKQIEAEQKAGL